MKKQDVKIGRVYLVTVSGKRARVRLTGENPNGGWDGRNIDTKRKVRVKTAGRLQREIADPDAPAAGSQPEPEAASAQPEPQEVQVEASEPQPEEAPGPAADDATSAAQGAHTPPEEPGADQEASTDSGASKADGM